MEIFSGFMVIASFFGFLLTVVWLILPFVVFAIKVKADRSVLLLEDIQRRLEEMERRLPLGQQGENVSAKSAEPSPGDPYDRPGM